MERLTGLLGLGGRGAGVVDVGETPALLRAVASAGALFLRTGFGIAQDFVLVLIYKAT